MSKFNPQPKKGMPPKKERKPLKRTPLKKGKKPTGEKEVFEEISEERDWICFVSKVPLRELKSNQFMHVLSKAENRFPAFKLYKKNIVLASDEIHRRWDFAPRSTLTEPFWKPLFELEQELLNEHKSVTI